MGNLVLDDNAKNDVSKVKGIQTILKIIEKYREDKKIQRNSTGFLRNVTHKSTECQNDIIAADGLSIILKTLNNFKEDRVVKENLLAVLLNITSDSQNEDVAHILKEIINKTKQPNAEVDAVLSKFLDKIKHSLNKATRRSKIKNEKVSFAEQEPPKERNKGKIEVSQVNHLTSKKKRGK